MAISITSRPRVLAYTNTGSPSVPVYSAWNTSENRGGCVYGFGIVDADDKQSTIELKIYEVGADTLLSESYHRPYKIGTFYLDIASYVKDYLYAEFDGDFDGERNKKDVGASIRVYITWRQLYANGDESELTTDAYPVFVARAALQYGATNGANLIDYVIFPDEQAEQDRGKFLTKFDEPVKWLGYDRTISFIWDNYMRANEITAVQIDKNINYVQVDNNTEALDYSQFNAINMVKVLDPSNSLAHYTELYFNLGSEVSTVYVEEGYVVDGYTTIQ